jgi:hypothetical protein
MLKNPSALPHMQQAAALAKFKHGLYEVVETHSNLPRLQFGVLPERTGL